jgi:DNA-binding LacI/PurR family transcriptional regulator
MATIKEVAAAAGVQPATVSYVMNGTGSVSEATRQRVLAAAAALGYEPSHMARSLQRRRSRTLGLPLTGERTGERSGTLLGGIADGAAAAGYDLLVAARSGDDEAATYANLYRSGRIEGLVILDVRQDDERVVVARSLGIPHVCEGRPAHDSPFVAIDVEAGTMEALAHLVVLGYEQIGLITPSLDLALAAEQDAAYRAALAEAGLPFEEQLVVEGGTTEGEGYAAAADLLSLPEPPDAILAGSAALAWGTLHAAHDAGRRVGDDLALIVFDDPPSAAHTVPPLTAVRQPVWEVGHALATLLVGVIEGTAPATSVLLQSQLIVRRSCGEHRRPTTVGTPAGRDGRAAAP